MPAEVLTLPTPEGKTPGEEALESEAWVRACPAVMADSGPGKVPARVLALERV